MVGPLLVQQALQHCLVHFRTPGLVDDVPVMVQSQPRHPLQDDVYGRGAASLAVRVFDPQDKLTPVAPGVQPGKQGRAYPAYVQVDRWGWAQNA